MAVIKVHRKKITRFSTNCKRLGRANMTVSNLCKPQRKQETISTHQFFSLGIHWVLTKGTGLTECCGGTEPKYAATVDPSLIGCKPSVPKSKAKPSLAGSQGHVTRLLVEEGRTTKHLLLGMDRKHPHIEDLVLIKGKVQLPREVGMEIREEC